MRFHLEQKTHPEMSRSKYSRTIGGENITMVPCNGKMQTKNVFYFIYDFASAVLQYHTRALYSFEVGTHNVGHPVKAISSIFHT